MVYGKVSSGFLDHSFHIIYNHILFLNCIESEKKCFLQTPMKHKVQDLVRRRAKRATSDQNILFMSLLKPDFHS